MIKVTKDPTTIPPPVRRGQPSIYGFHNLKSGESVFIKSTDNEDQLRAVWAAQAFRHRNRVKGVWLTWRREPEGVRVWRVALPA